MKKLSSNELSEKTIITIKEFAPLITTKSLEITEIMYDKLFMKHPQLKPLFIFAPKNQPALIAEALSAYAVNIENLKLFQPALDVIAESHVRMIVKPNHYIMLGPILIESIEDVLGNAATIEFIDAIREAYKYLSDYLINMEFDIYNEG